MTPTGSRRGRITIYFIEVVRDAGGGFLPGEKRVYWETWANVSSIKNMRTAEAYQTDLDGLKEFSMRYRPDKAVTKNMIIKYEGSEYTIQSNIDVDQRKRELTILGMTRDDNGIG